MTKNSSLLNKWNMHCFKLNRKQEKENWPEEWIVINIYIEMFSQTKRKVIEIHIVLKFMRIITIGT